MYFHPKLHNGKRAPIAWQIKLFFLNINWPIEDNATLCVRIWDKLSVLVAFVTFCVVNEAELHYIVEHSHDIGMALEGMATYLILIELHFRIFNLALQKRSFKQFITEFYLKIYIEKDVHHPMYQKIQRNLTPTVLYSYSYIATLCSYFAIPVIGYMTDKRLLPFKMTFHYDYTQLSAYVPTLLATLWIGVLVVSFIVAESNLLATVILHLNGRYLLLQDDMKKLSGELLAKNSPSLLAAEFRSGVINIFERNMELNEFAQKLEQSFTFRIFIIMSFSAVLLCVLAFKAVTVGVSTKNVTYITWILAKILELVVFGELGSTLISTTNNMSSMYYLSNWEGIILHSAKTKENVDVMKTIRMAITLTQKPFHLTGLNFFSVSLEVVVAILQGAGSYFTCLNAFR